MRGSRIVLASLLIGLILWPFFWYLRTHSFTESKFYLATQLVVALGTFLVIVVSIFGKEVSAYFNPPILHCNVIRNDGDLVSGKDLIHKKIVYHLNVINGKRGTQEKNCVILLRHIVLFEKKDQKLITSKRLIAPYCFKWALTFDLPKNQQRSKDISYEEVLNFVTLDTSKRRIHPNLVDYFNDFDGFFSSENYTMDLGVEIQSDNFKSQRLQYFRVYMSCGWDDTFETISSSVRITEIAGSIKGS